MQTQFEKKPNAPQPPSRAWYLLALMVFLLGIIFGVYYIYKAFVQPTHIIKIAPSSQTIYVISPGRYTLWITEPKTSAEKDKLPVLSSAPDVLDKSTIVFKDTNTGQEIPVHLSKGWHFQTKETMRYSLGDVYFEKPGSYVLNISNPPKEIYYLYLHKPNIAQIIKYIVLSVVSFVLGIVLSIVILLTVFIKRSNVLNTKPIDMETLKKQPAVGTTWAMAIHLAGFAGLVFPFGNILLPLLLWALKRQDSSFVDYHGKEAVNFQISVSIYYVICIILSFIIIGLLLIPLLAAFQIIAMIIAAVSAAQGNLFRYPMSMRFIK